MKTWTVEHVTKAGTVLRGQAMLADGKVTVTRNGASASIEVVGDAEGEALQLLMELYFVELQQAPSDSKH